jgi:hypothetical protein
MNSIACLGRVTFRLGSTKGKQPSTRDTLCTLFAIDSALSKGDVNARYGRHYPRRVGTRGTG